MRVLFVSRAFPPITGGIENQNAGLARALAARCSLTLIANRRGKRFLPLFLPLAFLRMACSIWQHDVLLLGDAVLAPLGAVLKRLRPRLCVACVIHGLDVTYATRSGVLPFVYASLNLPALRRLDLLIGVGRATVDAAVALGVSRSRCRFIPNGICPEEFAVEPSRAALEAALGESLHGRRTVVRIGRYVAHKGVPWFIRSVLPLLPPDVLFIAAGPIVPGDATGDAGCHADCVRAAEEGGCRDRVRLLATLDWKDVKCLYANADVVVAPNVRVPGSMEGFGINVIEAAASGAAVVAARLDGLQDAIADGRNGFLVEPSDAAAFAARINALLADEPARRAFGAAARADVKSRFAWPAIAASYLDALRGGDDPPAA